VMGSLCGAKGSSSKERKTWDNACFAMKKSQKRRGRGQLRAKGGGK